MKKRARRKLDNWTHDDLGADALRVDVVLLVIAVLMLGGCWLYPIIRDWLGG